MWWRRAAFALNGKTEAPAWWRGLAPASPYPKPPKPAIAATRRQAAKGWPADTPGERADGARLADAVERIRWRPWHGRVQRALDLIGETLAWLEGMADAAPAAAA